MLLIRPNRSTFGLVFVLLAMVYAGFSQSNAAAYLLAFLTSSLALVSALHAWRNLHGVVLAVEPPPAIFEGETLPLRLSARLSKGRAAWAIEVSAGGQGTWWLLPELRPGEVERGELSLPAAKRGCYPSLPFRLQSTFPLGFFTACRRVELAQRYWVYPRPEGDLPLPAQARGGLDSTGGVHPEGDDFAGVRDWRPGESMRHIDWKAAARGDRLMVKQWSGGRADRLYFRWESLPTLESELRLRQLARWIMVAARVDASYELELPGEPVLAMDRGERHFHDCLRALARFQAPPAA